MIPCLFDPILKKSSAMKRNPVAAAPIFLAILFSFITGISADDSSLKLVFDSNIQIPEWEFTDSLAWKTASDTEGEDILVLKGASEYQPKVRSPLNIAWLKNLEVTDFVLEVEAKSTSREYGHRDLCFFFGRQSESEFYYVHIATKADPHANSIFLVNNEPRISIADKRTGGTRWTDGKFHKIRIERNTAEGRILVYFDDMEEPIMEAVDRTFASGQVGLGSFDDVGEFRNLKIFARK